MEPIKLNNPFTKKLQELREKAAATCKGCNATLPSTGGEDTIRAYCADTRAACRKLYRAKTRLRTADRYV